jgi:hypothetical protein
LLRDRLLLIGLVSLYRLAAKRQLNYWAAARRHMPKTGISRMKYCVAFLLGLSALLDHPLDASAMSRVDSPSFVYSIDMACSATAPAGSSLDDAWLCDEASRTLRDLSSGKLDRDVAVRDEWKEVGNPNARTDCLRKHPEAVAAAGACDWSDLRLTYSDKPLPLAIVQMDQLKINQPQVLAIRVFGQIDSTKATVTIEFVEPANPHLPQSRTMSFSRDLDLQATDTPDGPMMRGLQMLLADYFTPYKLNTIMGNVVALKRR